LLTIYTAFYRNSPWVTICESGVYPQTKWACGSNLCYIGIEVDRRTGRVIVMSAIDNLIKGQAGQAIQCLNLMMGWDETLDYHNWVFILKWESRGSPLPRERGAGGN
jgi:N-acetyl-gamma-glutamyl-phosphate reductase